MKRTTRLLSATILAGLLAVGCTPHLDQVTFFGARTAVHVGPAIWCEVDYGTDRGVCDQYDSVARLDLKAGDALQISVDPAIGEQAWLVVYQVDAGSGEPEIRRTPLKARGELATVVRVAPTERILTAEVQAEFLQVAADAEGTAADYRPAKLWVMVGADG